MGKESTEIVAIIDRSGSMHAIRRDTTGGFNSFLAQQRAEPGDATMTVVLFSTGEERVLTEDTPLDAVAELNDANYVPMGATALLDAVGSMIERVHARRCAMPEHDRPDHVIVAILTDGQENSSTQYSRAQVRALIEAREAEGWDFVFLGANQDAFAEAGGLGIKASNTASFQSTGEGTQTAFMAKSMMISGLRRQKRAERAERDVAQTGDRGEDGEV